MKAPDKLKGDYAAMLIQPIAYIQAKELDFWSGTTVKYSPRWNQKGNQARALINIHDTERNIPTETTT